MTDQREQFMAALEADALRGLDEGPESVDVIVLLQGDGLERVDAAIMLAEDYPEATVYIAGGAPADHGGVDADRLYVEVLGYGIDRSRIVRETRSQNTREQAVAFGMWADGNLPHQGRTVLTVLLVASPEHQYRAFLTFLQAIGAAGIDDRVRLISAPVERPVRPSYLLRELEKIDRYGGHVATYADGLAYLARWNRSDAGDYRIEQTSGGGYVLHHTPNVVSVALDWANLSGLVRSNPTAFYPQDWYRDEVFAHRRERGTWRINTTVQSVGATYSESIFGQGRDFPAVVLVAAMLDHPGLWADRYLWTSDGDGNGDRVYVGGSSLGRVPGIQIHRHLTIGPAWGVVRAAS